MGHEKKGKNILKLTLNCVGLDSPSLSLSVHLSLSLPSHSNPLGRGLSVGDKAVNAEDQTTFCYD